MCKPVFSLAWALALVCGLAWPARAVEDDVAQQGQAAFARGDYLGAVAHWQNALAQASLFNTLRASDQVRLIDLEMRLSAAYQASGDYAAAYRALQQAAEWGETAGTPAQRVLLRSQAGDLLLAMQQPQTARERLEQAVTEARALPDQPMLLAHALNNLGNLHSVEQAFDQAVTAYREAMELAGRAGYPALRLKAESNLVRALGAQSAPAPAIAAWQALKTEIAALPESRDQAFYQVNLGELALLLVRQFPEAGAELLAPAAEGLRRAERLAGEDARLRGYALGFLGEIAEQRNDAEGALGMVREAIFVSQPYPDLLYRWEWLRGRLLQRQGQYVEAEAAYRLALAQLQRVRSGLGLGQRDAQARFYREVRPVYYSVADVLLHQAAAAGGADKQALLKRARIELEQLKLAELQNYFSDPCLAAPPGQSVELDTLAADTAVLYPVVLPDRLELLLSLNGQIEQIVVPATAAEVEPTARAFQQNLQNRSAWRFIREARTLYDWLITPVRGRLLEQHVRTLVLVPDGLLRMIPLAALHDGEHYLVEQFSLALTPGLALTDPRNLPRSGLKVLLNGLSEGVQGFSPLPEVRQEINTLQGLFADNSTVLLDQGFLLDTVGRQLEATPYTIVHVASHAQFARDADNTFLLTYDGKLTMNRLEQLLAANLFRERPVELLTLSACQTAVGDERAALGLAGVALKAGSRSALASLWFVSDEATAALIAEFYRALQDPALSKAEALRQAQRTLIERREFRHPAYWAPFLLIGNWL